MPGAGELETDLPYGVVRQLLERAVQGVAPTGAAALAVPALDPAVPADPRTANARAQIMHGLYWLCADLAAEQPVALVIDDCQWCDEPSLRFVEYMARRLAELRIVILLGLRNGEHTRMDPVLERILADQATQTVSATPLGDGGAARLLEAVFHDSPDAEFARACRIACVGNPFFLGELASALLADGFAPTAVNATTAGNYGPSSVVRSILVRLGAESAAAVELARAAAILGDGARLEHAATLAELDAETAQDAFCALTSAQILDRRLPLVFVHPIVRSSIYEDLPPAQCATSHLRAARLLLAAGADSERVAAHLLETEPEGDAQIAEALHAAGTRARGNGAPIAAVRYLRRALEEPPEPARRAALLVDLGRSEVAVLDLDQAEKHLGAVLDDSDDPRLRARCFPDLAWAAMGLRGAHAGAAALEREVAFARDRDPQIALWLESHLVAFGAWDPQTVPSAVRHLPPADEVSADSPGGRMMLACIAHLGWFACPDADDITDAATRAFAGGQLLHDTSIDDMHTGYVLYSLALTDDVALAEQFAAKAIAEARARGSLLGFAVASGIRALSRARAGSLRGAEADGRDGLQALAQLGPLAEQQLVSCMCVRPLVDALAQQGRTAEARAVLVETRFDGEVLNLVPANPLLQARGRLALAERDYPGALADFTLFGARSAPAEIDNPADEWRVGAAAALAATGEPDAARDLLVAQEQLAVRWGRPGPIGIARHALARLAPVPERSALLAKAVAVLERSPLATALAAARLDLAAALRADSEREAALEQARLALDAADARGAEPLAARARDEITVLGRTTAAVAAEQCRRADGQ